MDKLHLDQHISQRFNLELEGIRNKVLKMGGLVEHQVGNGLTALLEGDGDLGAVVAQNDFEVNALEVEIDEECTQVLARRQPAASDLRLIVTVIKVITDLERIGDEAEKLGRFSVDLSATEEIPGYRRDLRHLGELVRSMLTDALDAFARLDVDAAIRTAARDEDVNREYETLERLLATHLVEDPRQVSRLFKITWCARALERIGDHSVNICEYVVYLVKGARHPAHELRQDPLGVPLARAAGATRRSGAPEADERERGEQPRRTAAAAARAGARGHAPRESPSPAYPARRAGARRRARAPATARPADRRTARSSRGRPARSCRCRRTAARRSLARS